MKKSELKQSIQSEIIDILEQEDAKAIEARAAATDAETVAIGKKAKALGDLNKVMTKEGNDQDDGYVQHKYDDSVVDKYNIPVEPTAVFEDDEDEPKAKDLKGEPLSKIGYKLADTQKEMKQVVKKYSAAEGDEKEKLKDRLRELNKIKKELESLLESKR